MQIVLTNVMVDDQAKAHAFYTEKLGFIVKSDVEMGPHRWLTVVSPEAPEGVELLLEPMAFEPARVFQQALYEAGIPAASFAVEDIDAEYQQLVTRGVLFKNPPTPAGDIKIALLDDTCGNLIQIVGM